MLPRPWWRLPQSMQCRNPGGCISTLCLGYSSPSVARGHNSLAWRPDSPVGVWIHVHPKWCTSPGWFPWGSAAGFSAAVALIADGHHHDMLVEWNIWPSFPPCLWFQLRPLSKFNVLPPVESTSVYIVFVLPTDQSKQGTTLCPTIPVSSRWGRRPRTLPLFLLPWRTCSIKYRKWNKIKKG